MSFDLFRLGKKRPPPTPPKRDDLVERFDALALAKGKVDFVGGFATEHQDPNPNSTGKFVNIRYTKPTPERAEGWYATPSPSFPMPTGIPPPPGELPRPPALMSMPMPNLDVRPSLTMQHALSAPAAQPQYRPDPPSRPSSGPNISPSARLHPQTALQVTPTRPRASSTPATPVSPPSKGSSDSALTQCSGTTKKGERCGRQVKAPPPLYFVDPDAPVERFCFQHTKEVLGPSGFYSRKGPDKWVDYAKWIPEYLHSDTQAALRVEMEKPPSASDVEGYIYTFEIRDPKTPKKIHLKVGRAVHLNKRIDEWSKQCGSKEQVLRGWWPATVEAGEVSLMKGRVKQGERGPYCHRLERLVHLELADLALHAPYLTAHLPSAHSSSAAGAGNNSSPSSPSTPVRKGRSPASPAGGKVPGKPCPDCGTVHKEIFSFTRPERGPYKGQEWERIVKPVIEKWGGFVESYV